jgi:hypothetical protein
MRTTTNPLSSSTISVTVEKSLWTSLPDSENHLEKREWELISISLPWGYLNHRADDRRTERASRREGKEREREGEKQRREERKRGLANCSIWDEWEGERGREEEILTDWINGWQAFERELDKGTSCLFPVDRAEGRH